MKNNLGKILVLGVILIFFGMASLPTINAISKQQIKNTNEENKAYFYCYIDINGTGEYFQLPIWGTTVGVNGSISIQALFSVDIVTRKIIKFNDKVTINGNYIVLIKWFIGTKSKDNGEVVFHGFAFCAAPAPVDTISRYNYLLEKSDLIL